MLGEARPERAEVGRQGGHSSIVNVCVQPVEIESLPVDHWELTITGLKMGTTQVHVQETVAPPSGSPSTPYDFVLDVTVLGLPS